MSKTLDNLTSAFENLSKSVKKDLEEIRQHKREVQLMQERIKQDVSGVRYVRDEQCLILSAPHIIIGNVDSSGRLYSGNAQVVIRGNDISTEATGAVGTGGSIRNRATTIENIAVDPGIDGLENVVFPNSKIINQARAVTLQSNDEEGCFSTDAIAAQGVNLVSDSAINIDALAQNKGRKEIIDARVKMEEESAKHYATTAAKYKTAMKKITDKLQELANSQGKLNGSTDLMAVNYEDVYGRKHEQFHQLEQMLYSVVSNYISCLSLQAEAERSATALKATKTALTAATESFDTKTTGSQIRLNSELISIHSTDGDGSIRENDGAGLSVSVPHVFISSHDKDGKIIKDSSFTVNAQDLTLTTANSTYDDEKHQSGQFPAEGKVTITSKEITVQAIDEELKDKKIQEKAVTAGGKIALRAENLSMVTNATDGTANGNLTVNAKTMNIAAMDVDKDSREDKEIAAGTKINILAEKTYVGTTEKSELIQVAAKKVAVIGKETAEMQQDGKAVVTTSGGNLTMGGSKVEINGNTTIAGNAEIKGETKSPKVTSDQVEAKSAFKSPNINDTQGAGVPGAAGQPSAKLQEDVAKTKA